MCKSKNPIQKKGELYDDFKKHVRPFDLICFKGDALFSSVISFLEKRCKRKDYNGPNSGEFSHVAMVVNSDVLTHEKILPGRLYVLESVLGGSLGHNVNDIEDRGVCGVQIRDLETLINAFDLSDKTIVDHGKLINNPLDSNDISVVRARLTEFCNQYLGKSYDANVYSLLSAAVPSMRKYRKIVEEICHTTEWYFCSEIVALAYKAMDVYPPYVDEKDVLPRDLITPEADTDPMPKIIMPITYITTPIHQSIKNKCIKQK